LSAKLPKTWITCGQFMSTFIHADKTEQCPANGRKVLDFFTLQR
jgi:hypothetical protein